MARGPPLDRPVPVFAELDRAEFPMMVDAVQEAGVEALEQPDGFDGLLEALVLGLQIQLQGRVDAQP